MCRPADRLLRSAREVQDAWGIRIEMGTADVNGIIHGLGRVDGTAVCLQEQRTTGNLGHNTDSTRPAVFRVVPRETVSREESGGALSFL